MASTHEDIERRAFQLWQDRGCPLGSPEVDWQHAEQEFSENQASDGDAGGRSLGQAGLKTTSSATRFATS